MDTHEQRVDAYEAELRDKYTQKDRDKMAGKEAMADGSYPIADAEDLSNAIHAVGRGGADHDKIRAHVIARAKALGLSKEIPDNWGADGSLKQDNSQATKQDPKVAAALAAAHGAVQDASDAQALDPDKDTDPDDAEVSAHIGAAGDALTKALAAQAKDGADDPPTRSRKRERHRAVPLMPEVRHFRATGLEVRTSSATNEITVTGSPIVYDTPYMVTDMFGEFQERMARGVADDVIARGADVRFLLNHDGLPMARTLAGTMTVTDTPEALRFTARLDARQQLANDLAIAIERGDVSQMSCGFIVARDEWDDNMEDRTIHRFADLLDVSAVTYPASPTTSIEIAKRMAFAMPLESQARMRQMYVDIRAGKVLSQGNQDKLVGAVKTLHEVLGGAGYNPADLIDEPEEPNVNDDSEPDITTLDDGTVDGNTNFASPAGASDGTRSLKTAQTLRLELELRRRRIAA